MVLGEVPTSVGTSLTRVARDRITGSSGTCLCYDELGSTIATVYMNEGERLY